MEGYMAESGSTHAHGNADVVTQIITMTLNPEYEQEFLSPISRPFRLKTWTSIYAGRFCSILSDSSRKLWYSDVAVSATN